jgi:hypothetical protein
VPLCLKDAVYQVRKTIGELQAFNWSDFQIVADLNYGAREMCSVAGSLTRYQQLSLSLNATTGTQEVALDVEVDGVKACKYFSGQLFNLQYHDWKGLQIGAATGSIPLYYYLKTETRQLTPQASGTSNIAMTNIGPGSPLGEVYRTVLGVWPIPPNPAQIHAWYSYFHNWMSDPTDPCAIPSRFLWPWACYAIAKCKRMEQAIGEAQEYEGQFEAGKEQYRIYMGKQKQQDKPARYGMQDDLWRRNPSSSVVIVDPNSGHNAF